MPHEISHHPRRDHHSRTKRGKQEVLPKRKARNYMVVTRRGAKG